ncbi:MAG: phosphatidylserine decarboxylase family protein [Verrucomicrobiae bacterium]|nr:phosphatidylserine decarboxylase family protein [Verrucomicrobiae bacterium]
MKHAGKARNAAFRLILLAMIAVLALVLAGFLGTVIGASILALTSVLVGLWLLFVVFTLYFFRDPSARVPAGKGLVVSPAHGTVDLIDETTEAEFMGGPCQRISIFLSVFDVHVQKAPISGNLVFHKHQDGQYLSATRSDCGSFNENVLLGIVPNDFPERKIGVRLIAGLIARRIIVWATTGESVTQGERLSLIQFGSRADVYLPPGTKVQAKLGDKVIGGETVLATLE